LAPRYITIESVTGGIGNRVKQDLKYRTGNFVWRIKFNIPLNPSSVNNQNLYVTTDVGTPLKTNIRYDSVNNCIEIEPLEAYSINESYTLHITKNVSSSKGRRLQNEVAIKFKL
jgi:hypothetical protein